jgi:hypothetical protein
VIHFSTREVFIMRFVTFLVIVALLGAGVYVGVFKRGDARRKAGGFGEAKTPTEAVELFMKAMKERDFDIAADYCTDAFAAQMRACQAEANEFAVKLDNMIYQFNERGLIRDEMKQVFICLDPFPKDFTTVVGKESNGECEVAFRFNVAFPKGGMPAGMWALRPEIFNVYLSSWRFDGESPISRQKLKKVGEAWKFDFPVNANLQRRTQTMKEKAKNYVNPFSVITQEVKTDPTTKENVTKRLKELLEQAARE